MSSKETQQIIELLKGRGVQFEPGLTDEEIIRIESKFNFRFPIDLKSFLQTALPSSDQFNNWRQGLHSERVAKQILDNLDKPLLGMLFDLKNNNFWIKEWGERPKKYKEQEIIAKNNYYSLPKLIPIYSHRYIPSEPMESSNPVFSVHQMDIVYYGFDLPTYFSKEFNFTLPNNFQIPEKPNIIRFWTWWVEEGWMEDQ